MTSNPNQVIVATEDCASYTRSRACTCTIGTFPRSGAKATRSSTPPSAWPSCCHGLSTVRRATRAGKSSSVPSEMSGLSRSEAARNPRAHPSLVARRGQESPG